LHERVHLIPIKVAKYNEKVTLTQPLVAQILEVGSLLAGNRTPFSTEGYIAGLNPTAKSTSLYPLSGWMQRDGHRDCLSSQAAELALDKLRHRVLTVCASLHLFLDCSNHDDLTRI